MRKGFGGNYRRASDSFTIPRTTKPSSASSASGSSSSSSGSSGARHLDSSSLKSSSFCHKNCTAEPDPLLSSTSNINSSSGVFTTAKTENPQQSKNIPRDRDSTGRTEKKQLGRCGENLVAGRGTGAHPSTGCQGDEGDDDDDGSEGETRQIPLLTGSRQGPLMQQLTEDDGSSVSVKECVKSLERMRGGAKQPVTEENSKPASKTRISELRETILLRRSSGNLAEDADCSDDRPPKVNKRPVSALLDSSIATFPKIPISLIQRRSIGSLLLKPSLTSAQQRPPLNAALNPVLEPKALADKKESKLHEKQTDGFTQSNLPKRRSLKTFSSLGRKDVRANVCSLPGKSNLEESGNKNETETSCDIGISGADPVAGSLIKTDSSDSGIDTKTDCFGNKSGSGGAEGLPLEQFQTTTNLEKLSHSSGQQSTFSRIQGNGSAFPPQQCSGLNKTGDTIPLTSESVPQGDTFNFSSASAIFVDLESDELGKISSEEVLFEELAAQIVARLKDCESDLHDVLAPSELYRTPFYYMVDVIQGVKIPEFWVKLPTVNIHAECETSSRSLEEDEKSLLDSVKRKLEVIKKNRDLIKEKIMKRKDFESQVSSVIKHRLEAKKYDKYCLYLSELDKVLHLMFMLASRLANTDNALNCLRPGDNEASSKLLIAKRTNLIEKLDDAKLLKDGIDHRSKVVDGFLKASLSESEYAAYQDLVSAIIRLHFLLQWTEHRQLRSERQLKALNAAALVKPGSAQC